ATLRAPAAQDLAPPARRAGLRDPQREPLCAGTESLRVDPELAQSPRYSAELALRRPQARERTGRLAPGAQAAAGGGGDAARPAAGGAAEPRPVPPRAGVARGRHRGGLRDEGNRDRPGAGSARLMAAPPARRPPPARRSGQGPQPPDGLRLRLRLAL